MTRQTEADPNIAIANCLMLLSRGGQFIETSIPSLHHHHHHINNSNSDDQTRRRRVFECKTCNRQFPSFQALGGHRASHKKPRFAAGAGGGAGAAATGEVDGRHGKPAKTHECSICGLEFAIGQALGGHMRRHRAAAANNNSIKTQSFTTTTVSSSSSGGSTSDDSEKADSENNKRKRVLVLDLDLNLTPLENDLEFLKIHGRNPSPPNFEISFSF